MLNSATARSCCTLARLVRSEKRSRSAFSTSVIVRVPASCSRRSPSSATASDRTAASEEAMLARDAWIVSQAWIAPCTAARWASSRHASARRRTVNPRSTLTQPAHELPSQVCRRRPVAEGRASIGVFRDDQHPDRHQQNLEVEPDRPIVDIFQIVGDALAGLQEIADLAAQAMHLRPPGDARLYPVPGEIVADRLVVELVSRAHGDDMRPRPDDRHLAAYDVDELRQLVEAE